MLTPHVRSPERALDGAWDGNGSTDGEVYWGMVVWPIKISKSQNKSEKKTAKVPKCSQGLWRYRALGSSLIHSLQFVKEFGEVTG